MEPSADAAGAERGPAEPDAARPRTTWLGMWGGHVRKPAERLSASKTVEVAPLQRRGGDAVGLFDADCIAVSGTGGEQDAKLNSLGGQWNRSMQAWILQSDQQKEAIAALRATGSTVNVAPEPPDGWGTPRDMKSSLQGLEALSRSAVLRDDVCQSMVAVVQGKEPLVDDRSLHNITTSADDIAALDESGSGGGGADELSVRVEDSQIKWPDHRTAHPRDTRTPALNASVGSGAFRGGRSSLLTYIRTPAEIDQQRKMQGDLSMGVDRAHGELESELGKVDAVEGIRSQNWDPMCSRHAAELDKQTAMLKQRQGVVRDATTVQSEVEKLTAARTEEDRARAARGLGCVCLGGGEQAKRNRKAMAELENGRVVGVLLQLLSPRYRSSTHREALWTLVLLAEEEKARKACRDNRCFPKLFKLLGSRSEPTVEAACQLLARLAYDEQCAEMMVAAGGVPLLAPMTSYPNFKIRDLAQDATQALEEFATFH